MKSKIQLLHLLNTRRCKRRKRKFRSQFNSLPTPFKDRN